MYTSLSCLLGVPISCLRPVNESPDSGTPSSPSANTAGSSVEYSDGSRLHFCCTFCLSLCVLLVYFPVIVSSCVCVVSVIALPRNPIHLDLSFFLTLFSASVFAIFC